MGKGKNKFKEVKQKLAGLFEKLGKLTKIHWLLINVITIAVIGGAYSYFVLMPKYEELEREKNYYSKQFKKLTLYKAGASKIKKYEKLMAQKTEAFNQAMEALPDKRELPSLLTNISKAGSDAGLAFHLFQPAKEVNKEYYKEIPVSIKVQGRYHQISDFFFQIKKLNRIVNINNVDVRSKKGSNRLEMGCRAVTYMFVEKEESTGKKNKKRK